MASDPLPARQPIAEAVDEELGFLALLRSLHLKVGALSDLRDDVAQLRAEVLAVNRAALQIHQRVSNQAAILSNLNENFSRVVSVATVQGLTIDRVERKLDRLLEVFTVKLVPDPTPPGGGV